MSANVGTAHQQLLALGEHEQDGWEKAWQDNVTPWDGLGDVQPPLRDLLVSVEDDKLVQFPRGEGRALVPGCGRGYDPIFIARTLGLDVLAVDISQSAVDAANELLLKTGSVAPGRVTFHAQDFFAFGVREEEKFDLIYEHTLRAQWGQQMNALVKPGGLIVALVYPVDPPREWGPPYAVRKEDYEEVLGTGWDIILERIPEISIESHKGRETNKLKAIRRQDNVTPWDNLGSVQPPLKDLLESSDDDQLCKFPRKGKALVPGCGRGYDPIFIASTLGLDVLAVDISKSALDAANELLATSSVLPGNVTFKEQDFFTLAFPETEKVDLVYDYTLRAHWGQQMNALIKSGGLLVTLVFPIDPPQDYGPPFFVRKEHYVEALGDGWELVLERVPEVSKDSHVGRELLVVWRKK
ncbi:SubName: Full=Uncharacterized protein {ECO:0000313/EMBL:CCA72986.1} [Serendipita indica DSM 11827]|nr:SubName: Full=Uncharacterized protein {ECO:0000313/EMBL:CCA72986.1} [Serendipita indica DSM 11827]